MKKNYNSLITILMVAIMSFSVVSCGKIVENDNENEPNIREYSDYEKRMISELTGTSWRFDKLVNRTKTSTEYGIITFVDNERLQIIDYKTRDGDYISTKDGAWYFNNNILVFICHVPDKISYSGYLSAALGVNHEISSLTSSSMILVDPDGDETRYFSRVNYREIEDKTPSGGTSYGDVPYVTDFAFTSTKSSITVKFTCSERPTSATVKYGTSSTTKTASSTIAGKQVSATVSGLKSGTKYYFSCTVRNSNGSSTSDNWPAMTQY